MRTLAIGDIHGCLTALDRLLAEVDLQPDDVLVTLGDYVDRGPASKGVIDRLLDLSQRCQLLPLRGNHEVMMIRAHRAWQEAERWRTDPTLLVNPAYRPRRDTTGEEREWLACGGREAVASYGKSLADVPAAHWEFIEETCQDWFETDTHIFVHANVYPDCPLAEQPSFMLHWEKMYQPVRHCSGKTVVCGHTPQRSGRPRRWPTTIVLDTWVYGDGWLSCLDATTGRLWQANQRGEYRGGFLDAAEE